ncbi:MAG TPA: DnaJ domain-containing protein [Polyangiaceae bacterium]|nr:DnaJ domain-containing protein [Polyangiaceae bacterium]
MFLPSRLRQTTLGDLLGALHRERASGTLELVEDRGREHRIHLAGGLIVAVELDAAGPSLADILRRDRAAEDDVLRRSLLRAMASRRLHGEVLVEEFHLSPAVVGGALRRQVLARLAVLEDVADARVGFRVALRPPHWALHELPVGPSEFLKGRRRARERASPSLRAASAEEGCAFRVLGVAPGAEVAEIKRAYRRLVRSVHPDLHPEATEEQRRSLEARFVEINHAFKQLVA